MIASIATIIAAYVAVRLISLACRKEEPDFVKAVAGIALIVVAVMLVQVYIAADQIQRQTQAIQQTMP